MKRTLPAGSQPAALASTLPPTSDNVMSIPSDVSAFITVLLFPGPVYTKCIILPPTDHASHRAGRNRWPAVCLPQRPLSTINDANVAGHIGRVVRADAIFGGMYRDGQVFRPLNACVASRTPRSMRRWSIRQYRVHRRA